MDFQQEILTPIPKVPLLAPQQTIDIIHYKACITST